MHLKDVINQKGNVKLPKTTAIFNMTSATSCPSLKLGLCKAKKQGAKCYALKAEEIYPNVLPYRNRQNKYWIKVDAETFINEFLEINNNKRKPFTKLRFNESGDFISQKCLNKAEKIAKVLKGHGIKVYCYTSRSDLDFRRVKDLIISGSNFQRKGISNIFKIIKKDEKIPIGFSLCGMSCKKCDRCSEIGKKTVVVKH